METQTENIQHRKGARTERKGGGREGLRASLKGVNHRHLSSERLNLDDLIAGVFTLTSPKASVTCRPALASTSLGSTRLYVYSDMKMEH